MKKNTTFDPVFRSSVFHSAEQDSAFSQAMSTNGVIKKSLLALLLLGISAVFAWKRPCENIEILSSRMLIFSILSIILYFVSIFSINLAQITVPMYAIVEGFLLGSISLLAEIKFPGLVTQAILATIGVLFSMLFIYKTGIIKPTKKLAIVISSAILGIAITYIIDMFMVIFSGHGLSFIRGNSAVSIGFSAVVCVIAALRLLFNFDFIEEQSRNNAPKKMEWIATLGLMVTLIWIYLEILNLLMKLRSRND